MADVVDAAAAKWLIVPQLGWIAVVLIGIAILRRPIFTLITASKVTSIKLPGGVEVALTAREAGGIVQDLINFLETLTADQVQLLFCLLRLKFSNQLFRIPSPDQGRRNTFHNNLRSLREGHLVHGLDEEGKSAGQFHAGRLVELFPWTFKLPDLVTGARTPGGQSWQAIREEVAKLTPSEIRTMLEAEAMAAPPADAASADE